MNCALPPVALSKKKVAPPALVVMTALPPVLWSKKLSVPLLLVTMLALPAVLEALNSVSPLELVMMVALPAVGVSVPKGWPKTVLPKSLLVMVADAAVAESAKSV